MDVIVFNQKIRVACQFRAWDPSRVYTYDYSINPCHIPYPNYKLLVVVVQYRNRCFQKIVKKKEN